MKKERQIVEYTNRADEKAEEKSKNILEIKQEN